MKMQKNSDKLIVNVFGKPGCAKCKILNERIDKLLTDPKYSCFEKQYNNLMTEEGLMKFCLAQCINPNRVPGMLISALDQDGKEFFLENVNPDEEDAVCGKSKLYQFLGIQTDYSEVGKGIIKPEMITKILDDAKAMAGIA